ncbi:MAG: T9SS type A sorting domain-containing protein [Flavipsychrobacter sp.]
MKKLLLALLLSFPFISRAQIITTIAGSDSAGYSGDGGLATNARLNYPTGIRVDDSGNVFIADDDNNVIRKVDGKGFIRTIAGNHTGGYKGDGGLATSSSIHFPGDISLDKKGNVYIVDSWNSVIRKVSKSGIITTIAGCDTAGYSGDGGPAVLAKINIPSVMDIDARGNIYISDQKNGVIRKIDTTGIITTIAGTPGILSYTGDGGPAIAARLGNTCGLRVDAIGNVYVADHDNNAVRKIDTAGVITTIAGSATKGYSGDGGPAKTALLFHPMDVALDRAGNLYIADEGNNVIRKIDTNGIITTVAGIDSAGYNGDSILAGSAQLHTPCGITTDKWGNLYIADTYNQRIRKVIFDTDTVVTAGIAQQLLIPDLFLYPNPTHGFINISSHSPINSITITNTVGQMVYIRYTSKLTSIQIDISNLPSGIYYLHLNNAYTQKIIKN